MQTIRARNMRATLVTGSPGLCLRNGAQPVQGLIIRLFFALALVLSVYNAHSVQAAGIYRSGDPEPSLQEIQDLAITLDSSAGGTVEPGDTVTYTITVTNTSPAAQNHLLVTGALPAGTTYVPQSTRVSFQQQFTYEDHFDTVAYNNSDGTALWGGSWIEGGGDDGQPSGGFISIVNTPDGGRLRFDNDSYDFSLHRDLSLTGAASATLSFDYFVHGAIEGGDYLGVQIWNGPTYVTLDSYSGTLPAEGSYSRDISQYIPTMTRLRFSTYGFKENTGEIDEYLELDNVKITFTAPGPKPTLDNIPGGANTDLADGAPPNLVVLADAVSLLPGEKMIVTYQVQVNDPRTAGVWEITNTAGAASDEITTPVTAAAGDTLLFAEMTLEKTASPASPTIDDQVTYTFTVTNTGALALDNLTITDPLPGLSAVTCDTTTLAPTAVATCTAAYTVTLADVQAGVISNFADAAADDPSGAAVTAAGAVQVNTSLPQAPVAGADSASTAYNTPVTLPDVTANDTAHGTGNNIVISSIDLDPSVDGNQSIFRVDGHLWAADTSTGAVTYTPPTVYAGTASLTYSVEDRLGQAASSTLSVTVAAPAAPTAADDTATTSFNTPATLSSVTANDIANGEGNTILPATLDLDPLTPAHETGITLDGHTWQVVPGTSDVRFTPAEDFTGTSSLPYSVEDALGQHAAATLTVTVNLPAAPAAADNETQTPFNTLADLSDITANDTAYGTGNGFDLTTIDLNPGMDGVQTSFEAGGHTWAVNPTDGAVTFTPATNFIGIVSIPYSVEDQAGQSAAANLTVEVLPPGPPTAADDTGSTTLDSPVTLPDITANDAADGAGNAIVVATIDLNLEVDGNQSSLTKDGHTWAANTTTGEVTFTSAPGFSGTVTIPYSVEDLLGQEATASLTVTVDASFTLLSFTATPVSETQVTVRWTTATEQGTSGYRLLRAAANDITQAAEVTTLPADPLTKTYQFSDTSVPGKGQYWYWLVKVFVSTSEVTSDPVSVDTTPPNYPVFLPLIVRSIP